jgi:hypothetical protein
MIPRWVYVVALVFILMNLLLDMVRKPTSVKQEGGQMMGGNSVSNVASVNSSGTLPASANGSGTMSWPESWNTQGIHSSYLHSGYLNHQDDRACVHIDGVIRGDDPTVWGDGEFTADGTTTPISVSKGDIMTSPGIFCPAEEEETSTNATVPTNTSGGVPTNTSGGVPTNTSGGGSTNTSGGGSTNTSGGGDDDGKTCTEWAQEELAAAGAGMGTPPHPCSHYLANKVCGTNCTQTECCVDSAPFNTCQDWIDSGQTQCSTEGGASFAGEDMYIKGEGAYWNIPGTEYRDFILPCTDSIDCEDKCCVAENEEEQTVTCSQYFALDLDANDPYQRSKTVCNPMLTSGSRSGGQHDDTYNIYDTVPLPDYTNYYPIGSSQFGSADQRLMTLAQGTRATIDSIVNPDEDEFITAWRSGMALDRYIAGDDYSFNKYHGNSGRVESAPGVYEGVIDGKVRDNCCFGRCPSRYQRSSSNFRPNHSLERCEEDDAPTIFGGPNIPSTPAGAGTCIEVMWPPTGYEERVTERDGNCPWPPNTRYCVMNDNPTTCDNDENWKVTAHDGPPPIPDPDVLVQGDPVPSIMMEYDFHWQSNTGSRGIPTTFVVTGAHTPDTQFPVKITHPYYSADYYPNIEQIPPECTDD